MGLDKNGATAWGVGLYSKYQFNSWFSLAGRLEYLHADDGTLGFVDGVIKEGKNISKDENEVYVSQTDLYSATLTAGFDFWRNVGCRLEYRADMVSSCGQESVLGNGSNHQHTLALNLFYLF
ncbi:MAG: outer membrane beta-barrel protein [Verrucomicrobiia bacterium]